MWLHRFFAESLLLGAVAGLEQWDALHSHVVQRGQELMAEGPVGPSHAEVLDEDGHGLYVTRWAGNRGPRN